MKRSEIFLFLILFLMICNSLNSQTRADTINYLTKYSIKYLNTLFNKKDFSKVGDYWSDKVYDDLKAGYNNGNIPYGTDDDLVRLFSNDVAKLFMGRMGSLTFKRVGHVSMFEDDDGNVFFVINFIISGNKNLNGDLVNVGLDLISKNNGKTWKVNSDHWVKNLMYYLYKKNN